jgi:hypothetical protein
MSKDYNIGKKVELFFNKFNNNYFDYNPVGEMMDDLEKIGIKATTEFPISHVDYETSARLKLLIEDNNDIVVNLYRMSSGKYEVNTYEIKLSLKDTLKSNKIKP